MNNSHGVREGVTHVVELQLALVLFLQVSGQVVEHRAAAPPVSIEPRGPCHLVHLQARLLVWCGGVRRRGGWY